MAEEKASSSNEGFDPLKFLREVRVEMGKVQWATKRELVTDTTVVGIAVVIVCTLLWLCDTFFSRLFTLILR